MGCPWVTRLRAGPGPFILRVIYTPGEETADVSVRFDLLEEE
jgi:hypothetical protein